MAPIMPEPRYSNVKSSNNEVFTLILVGFCCDIPHNDAIGAYPSARTDSYISDDSGARAYDYAISDSWMSLTFGKSPRTQSHVVINHYIITDYCSLPDYNTHTVVNKKSSANSCSWMNFNSSYCSDPI
jgi:hypothetical protein